MEWKNIISFTDSNQPYRYKVNTVKMLATQKKTGFWYQVSLQELDEKDNVVDDFIVDYDTANDEFQTMVDNKPILIILEHMMELVKKGDEKW